MVCPLYLCMTPGEFRTTNNLPPYPGWMSCHFSPYGKGLSNLPREFPAKMMLVVDDLYPANGHEPHQIAQELLGIADRIDCILLDFQRPDVPLTKKIVDAIARTLPCPIGISQHYALPGHPVLIPPIPEDMAFPQYFENQQSSELWLEVTTSPLCLEISESGCIETEALDFDRPEHFCRDLLCHYKILQEDGRFVFLLWRKPEDIHALCEIVSPFGVTRAIGLLQEFL